MGDTFEETVENIAFGRIAAQTAKQVIVQRVKDAERELIVNRYRTVLANCSAVQSKK